MKEKLKDKKTILIVGLFLVLVAILGVSYAFFSARIIGNEDAKENIVKAGTMELTFTDGDDAISLLNAKPGDSDSKTFTVQNTGTLDDSYTYNIKLTKLTVTFKKDDLTYNLVEYTDDTYQEEKENGTKVNGVINKDKLNTDKEIYLATNITRPEKTEKHYYKLTITFEELDVDQNYNQGAKFSGKINVDTGEPNTEKYIASYSDYCTGVEDLASCMLEYASEFEEFVATDDPDHNARFMGADPNNYIYFNCADPEHPTSDTCELWRIIGSFNDVDLAAGGTKNLVKIIRVDNLAKDSNIVGMNVSSMVEMMRQQFEQQYDQIKDTDCQGMEKEECLKFMLKSEGIDPDNPHMYGLSWDYRGTETASSSTAYMNSANIWGQSTLMKTLNDGYIDNQMTSNGTKVSNSLYWNRAKGTCWSTTTSDMQNYDPTVECDFSNTGLRTTAHDMIENVKWHLGGSSSYSGVTAQNFYNLERGDVSYDEQPTTWDGKVALMYPSDYGYATSGGTTTRQICLSYALSDWDDYEDCYNNSWLLDKNSSNIAEWTLTPVADLSNDVFIVISVGAVDGDSGASYPMSVRSSLYLSSNVTLVGGVGTKTNPYVIKSM